MQEQGLAEQSVSTARNSSCSKWDQETLVNLPRKEKRKTLKKLKRKQRRRDAAEQERMEEEAQLNDPAEQQKIQSMEEADARALEIEVMEHAQQEKLWLENQKKAIEEAQRKRQEELEREERDKEQKEIREEEEESGEYIEEGPAEIIWQGNEIIVRKKRVRVPKDSNRPTSNPLPPQCAAFADYKSLASSNTGSMIFDGVEQQIPNFGTEQDKAHCPFHIKTGACRFGTRCSRAHFYPDKSCTLLMKNMYNGPGLTWEQDEGLEVEMQNGFTGHVLEKMYLKVCSWHHYVVDDAWLILQRIPVNGQVFHDNILATLEYTDEEVAQHYQEFYEDVHTEFLKFGEIVNFKVCRNGSAHLRGNVYVHYQSLDSAVAAYSTINGRFYAGKQITCEFIGVTRWKVAICGEYMKSRHMNCSHGSACNFLHCFRNPGDEYDWADWDNPPPRSWMIKMDALFGRLRNDGQDYWKQRSHEFWQGYRHSERRRRSSSRSRISRKHKEYKRDSWSDDDSGAIHHRGHSDGGRCGSGDERGMNSDLDEDCAVAYHRRTNQKGPCDSRGRGDGVKKKGDHKCSEEGRISTYHTYRRNDSKTCHRKRKTRHREQADEENSNNSRSSPDSSDIDLAEKKHIESKSCTNLDSDHSPGNFSPPLKESITLRRDCDKVSPCNEKGQRRNASRKGQDQIKSPNLNQDKIKSSRRSRHCSKSPRRHRDHGKLSRIHRDSKSTRRVRDGSRSQTGDRDGSYSPKIAQHSSDMTKRGRDSTKVPKRKCEENSDESPGRWQASDDNLSEFGPAI